MKFLIISTCILAYQVAVLYVESATPHQGKVDVDIGKLLNVVVSPNTVDVDVGKLLNVLVSPNGANGSIVKVNLQPRDVPEDDAIETELRNRTTETVELPTNGTIISDVDEVADNANVECPKSNGEYAYLLPDPTAIETFYVCDHGVAYKLACPDNLYFRKALKVCDWKSNLIL